MQKVDCHLGLTVNEQGDLEHELRCGGVVWPLMRSCRVQ